AIVDAFNGPKKHLLTESVYPRSFDVGHLHRLLTSLASAHTLELGALFAIQLTYTLLSKPPCSLAHQPFSQLRRTVNRTTKPLLTFSERQVAYKFQNLGILHHLQPFAISL